MSDQQRKTLDLAEFCKTLSTSQPNVRAVYLFGSRRYGGGSLRSDIDLFVEVEGDVKPADIRSLINEQCPALDIFILRRGIAISVVNETYVECDTNEHVLTSRNAVRLWSIDEGSTNEVSLLKQEYLTDIDYRMTVLPNTVVGPSIDALKERLQMEGLPTDPILGETTEEVVNRLVETAKRIVTFSKQDFPNRNNNTRAFATAPSSEYDLQDLFWISTKPWLDGIAREAVEVSFNGQKKKSDFSFNASRVIIEMKFAKTKNDKREIATTIDGLSRFYSENANVTHIVFIVYTLADAEIDTVVWQSRYQKKYTQPSIRLEIIRVD